MKNLHKYVEESYQLALDECFGYWIHNALWYGNDEDNLTLEETKEVFFLTLKKLLDDNLVVLFAPYSMFNEDISQWDKTITIKKYGDTIWGIPSDKIIQYMRDVFPKNIKDENDDKLIDFWFSEDCPQIAWIDQENGSIHAS